MVLANDLIFTAYGFWLPNDPCGSWSDFVRAWELVLRRGKATKIDEPQSVAHAPHDHAKRLQTKESLQHDPVRFTGRQALGVAHGFAKRSVNRSMKYSLARSCRITCTWWCNVMNDLPKKSSRT